MDGLLTVEEFCKWRYQGKLRDGKPTKAQKNTVARMCREGKFKRAFKLGKNWFIDLNAEMEGHGD